MRTGNNPSRGLHSKNRLEEIVLHVNTFLPNLDGYHAKRLEVVQTCLLSMVRGVNLPHSLIVYDSGSIPELTDWIQDVIKPALFIQSLNFGKTVSRKLVAQMIPAQSVLCYSDDDILFSDNWLAPQLELLNHFPSVACVTGYPVRTSFRWGNKNTLDWARKSAFVKDGRFIPDQWERDFCVSIGRDYEQHAKDTAREIDTIIEYKGVEAYATSHHCQQIGFAGTVNRALDWNYEYMASERGFDERLDALGLRLATIQRLARHMGNVIDDDLRKDIEALCLDM